jgi:hypothetical protein
MNQCFLEIIIKTVDKETAVILLDDLNLDLNNLSNKEDIWTYRWYFSYPGQENVAEGDFVEDLVSFFPAFLALKDSNISNLHFHFYIGNQFANPFVLDSNIVSFIAVLGGKIFMHCDDRNGGAY